MQEQLERSKQQNAHDLQLLESSLEVMTSEAKQAKQQWEKSRSSEQESRTEVERLQTELSQLLEQKKSAELKMQTEIENLRMELTRLVQQTKQTEADAKTETERLAMELARRQHEVEKLTTNHSRKIEKMNNARDKSWQEMKSESDRELARVNESVLIYQKEIEALKQQLHDKERNFEEDRRMHTSNLETTRMETERIEKQRKTERLNEIANLISDCSRELSQLEILSQQSESCVHSIVCRRFVCIFAIHGRLTIPVHS